MITVTLTNNSLESSEDVDIIDVYKRQVMEFIFVLAIVLLKVFFINLV